MKTLERPSAASVKALEAEALERPRSASGTGPVPVSAPAAPRRARRLLDATSSIVFKHVHGGQLIYNACWEDPRLDREMLQLNADSRVVMITSAGCNALDYLLDDPAEIHAIDMNFRQNAVLELKRGLLERVDHASLFALFGDGASHRHRAIIAAARWGMPNWATHWWTAKQGYFDPASLKRSFYFHGTAGSAAWLLNEALFRGRPALRQQAIALLEARSLAEQRELYEELEPRVWGRLSSWLVRQRMVMTLLGVPEPQIRLIENTYPGGVTAYVKDKLRHVMTALPIADNYFWRVYLTGRYTPTCCPTYLKQAAYATLASRVRRLHTHTSTVSQFLQKNPGTYSHYVLLDHQDWLAWHAPEALLEEWQLILANSRPGTRILLRSAGPELTFVPPEIRERLHFRRATTDRLHGLDRVGTYGSVHLAEVLP